VAEKSLRTAVIDEEHSLAKSTKPGPSHAIKKVLSVRAIVFQARRY